MARSRPRRGVDLSSGCRLGRCAPRSYLAHRLLLQSGGFSGVLMLSLKSLDETFSILKQQLALLLRQVTSVRASVVGGGTFEMPTSFLKHSEPSTCNAPFS